MFSFLDDMLFLICSDLTLSWVSKLGSCSPCLLSLMVIEFVIVILALFLVSLCVIGILQRKFTLEKMRVEIRICVRCHLTL